MSMIEISYRPLSKRILNTDGLYVFVLCKTYIKIVLGLIPTLEEHLGLFLSILIMLFQFLLLVFSLKLSNV